MKKGIPCNETRHTLKRDKNRIRYRFVTLDGNTPSDCTISIGDTDPLTGEVLTDMTFFTEYYRMEDHDIYSYWKTLRPPLTPAEKQLREEKKEAILESFRKEYGRFPSASDLHWLTDDFMPDRFTVSIDRFQDEEGNPESDKMREFGIPFEDPFGENEPDDIVRLREFAASLSGRMADIYEWLLVKYAGGQVKLSLQAIADKWGISTAQIYKDKDRLLRMIREHISTGDRGDRGRFSVSILLAFCSKLDEEANRESKRTKSTERLHQQTDSFRDIHTPTKSPDRNIKKSH